MIAHNNSGGTIMPTTTEKRAAFRQLHASGCFVIPNPWDIGTTRYLQSLGFKALATTSAGFAWSRGFADGAVTRDVMIDHIAELSAAASVPMNADFEGGYAHDPAGVAESVRLCAATACPACRSRITRATWPTRYTTSIWPWSACGPRARP